jgi:DNA-binding CsgD family transcriptional regulator
VPKNESVNLTPRERECLHHLALGLRSEEIARQLNVAKVTVDFHISNAKNKLQANTREQAVAIVVGSGLIKL